ncbi:MAG: hypothetical protein R3C99_07390 [Pirellulaceae bacterium]
MNRVLSGNCKIRRHNLLAAFATESADRISGKAFAHSREQHAQKVINFGDRANRAARVVARRLLRNRNRRPQPGDVIHVGLRHLAEKLAREAAEAFDVPTLTFREQRIERQRALAAAADTSQTD